MVFNECFFHNGISFNVMVFSEFMDLNDTYGTVIKP